MKNLHSDTLSGVVVERALTASWAMDCANLLQEKQHYVNADTCRPLHCLKYIYTLTHCLGSCCCQLLEQLSNFLC
jgi:hypothetical protein